jgi:hypothetical protein
MKAGDRVRCVQSVVMGSRDDVQVLVGWGQEGTVVDDHEGRAQVEFDSLPGTAIMLQQDLLEIVP